MKLLLILFVVLTILSTLCTGRTISRTLCEKIVSCKNRFLSPPVPNQVHDWHPQNNDNTDSMVNYENTKTETPYNEGLDISSSRFVCPGGAPLLTSGRCPIAGTSLRAFYGMMERLECPGGAPLLQSGRCSSPITDFPDYGEFY